MTSANWNDPSSPVFKKARKQYLKSTSHRDPNADPDWTAFRAAEKRYKSRFPPPNLSNVLDLALLDDSRRDEYTKGGCYGRSNAVDVRRMALKPSDRHCTSDDSKVAYVIPRIPGAKDSRKYSVGEGLMFNILYPMNLSGLVVLPSFVSPEEQRELVRWTIQDQARNPNQTNLDAHYVLPDEGLWNTFLRSKKNNNQDVLIQTRAKSGQANDTLPGPRQLVDNTAAAPSNFEAISAIPKPPPPISATVQPSTPSSLLYKLRWANIGWYYHWGSKQYDFTKGKSVIDERVRGVCRRVVAMIDWEMVFGGSSQDLDEWAGDDWRMWDRTYEPDAGIVNFYQGKDTLMAHVDRSEVCATSPLVSISLGNAAIFLIGGLTRDIEPIPILLRSGDVIVMSGPACRRAYHGVPRILENTLPPHFEDAGDDTEWQHYEAYLRTTRINVNVRQVFPKGFIPKLRG